MYSKYIIACTFFWLLRHLKLVWWLLICGHRFVCSQDFLWITHQNKTVYWQVLYSLKSALQCVLAMLFICSILTCSYGQMVDSVVSLCYTVASCPHLRVERRRPGSNSEEPIFFFFFNIVIINKNK